MATIGWNKRGVFVRTFQLCVSFFIFFRNEFRLLIVSIGKLLKRLQYLLYTIDYCEYHFAEIVIFYLHLSTVEVTVDSCRRSS